MGKRKRGKEEGKRRTEMVSTVVLILIYLYCFFRFYFNKRFHCSNNAFTHIHKRVRTHTAPAEYNQKGENRKEIVNKSFNEAAVTNNRRVYKYI